MEKTSLLQSHQSFRRTPPKPGRLPSTLPGCKQYREVRRRVCKRFFTGIITQTLHVWHMYIHWVVSGVIGLANIPHMEGLGQGHG